MKNDIKNSLIISLLKADLRNTKLINGLNTAGALVENFHTDLSSEIFKLIGFRKSEIDDELYCFYFNKVDLLSEGAINVFLVNLSNLSHKLHSELLNEKIRRREILLSKNKKPKQRQSRISS